MRKSPWIVAAALGVVTALVPVAQGVAASMSSPITPPPPGTLPIDNFSDLASDSAHHHLFVSSGWGSTNLLVTDESGATVSAIPLAGASGMTLVGNLLFVAEANAAEIAVIDTSSLQVVRRVSTGANSCPQTVAVVASRYLVYSDACANEFGDIGVIDGRSATLTPTTLTPPHGTYNPMVRAIPGTTNVVVADRGLSPSGVSIVDVAGTPSVVTSTWQLSNNCENLQDLAVAPDGKTFVPACGWPYEHDAFSTSDLSQVDTYHSHWYPDAAAFSPNGKFFAGGTNSAGVYIFALTESGHGAGGDAYLGGQDEVAPGGLAFSADAKKLFAVSEDWYNGWHYALHVIPIKQSTSHIFLSGNSTWAVGTSMQIVGRLALSDGNEQDGTPISVTRTVGGTTTTLNPATTSLLVNQFAITDTPTAVGRTTYTVHFAGDPLHRSTTATFKVNVEKIAPAMAIDSWVSNNKVATVTVTLVGGSTNKTVTITATPKGGKPTPIATGVVDAFGQITATYQMTGWTTFTASYAGDDRYTARSVHSHIAATPTSIPPLRASADRRATIAIENPLSHAATVSVGDDAFNQTFTLAARSIGKPFDYVTTSTPNDWDGISVSSAGSGSGTTDHYFAPGHSYLVRVVYAPSGWPEPGQALAPTAQVIQVS